jgi:hypothetical protein
VVGCGPTLPRRASSALDLHAKRSAFRVRIILVHLSRTAALAALVLLAVPPAASSQSTTAAAAGGDAVRKRALAVRITNGSIRVDGRLSDDAWRSIAPVVDFVQKEPVEGAPPSDPMEVRFAYDDDALYVGARMESSGALQAPLGRRDDEGRAESLIVSLDTYLDRRTASSFGITAAGVRLDSYYASDDEDADDEGYDPVWQGRVARDERGWTAELWIPFSQLRFNDRDPQTWGLNIQRWVPSRNEEVYWALVPRTEQRWASLFGDLHGLTGIRPRRRVELMPYVGGTAHARGNPDPDNPFTRGTDVDGRAGLDAKLGIGSNLTLEGTLNPDFGQVEADPAEVNLTAFETFFDERRPFFLEGGQLLSGFVNNYFYSRRIGAEPPGDADAEYIDRPSTTTILGAAKLTGRLASGTSVGFLAAVTGEETARTFDLPVGGIVVASEDDRFGRVRVAPRTLFGVGRVEQEFGPSGSTIGLMTTLVHRDLDANDPLAQIATRNAVSLSSDALLRLNDGEYEARMFAGGSYVDGEAAAIGRLQRSSARYFQRPDADHLDDDPTRTSLAGVKAGGSIERRTGPHWNWSSDVQVETAGFETNDLGRTSSVDQLQAGSRLSYRETVPGAWWRSYEMSVGTQHLWSLAGDREQLEATAGGSISWPNFWETDVEVVRSFRAYDPRLTRGGPLMQVPRGWRASVRTDNSQASRTQFDVSMLYGRDENGGLTFEAATELELQPGSQWQLSISPRYQRLVDARQYVDTVPRAAAIDRTFGRRYVFGEIDRSTYGTELRFTYTFKPDLTLDFYGEPFAASGRYRAFGELVEARSRLLRQYGTDGTQVTSLDGGRVRIADGTETFDLRAPDFNVRSFRSNLVLRWEWRPGSMLYLVWQQDREADEISAERASPSDMFRSFGTRGDHFFAIKASLWLSGFGA